MHYNIALAARLNDHSDTMQRPYSYRDDAAVPPFDDSAPVAVMDAECAVCSWSARMIHRFDRSGTVRICPIQTDLGAALLRHYGRNPTDPTSWLFVDGGIAHTDADAILHAGRRLGGWASLVAILRIFPKPLRDKLYASLARNRYALFGWGDMCARPDPAFRARLIG